MAHSNDDIRRHASEEEQQAARTSPAFSTDAKPPAFVTPTAAQVVKRLPEGDDWAYELKFDGYRAQVIKDKQRVELRSRKKKDLTGMYPGDRGGRPAVECRPGSSGR